MNVTNVNKHTLYLLFINKEDDRKIHVILSIASLNEYFYEGSYCFTGYCNTKLFQRKMVIDSVKRGNINGRKELIKHVVIFD